MKLVSNQKHSDLTSEISELLQCGPVRGITYSGWRRGITYRLDLYYCVVAYVIDLTSVNT